MKSNDWKDRLGIMYSTNPDFQYNTGDEEEEETLPKEKQLLRIALDKRNRSTWKIFESEMRCRWLGQRRGNHRTG